jgi:hypothetical protein
MKCSTKMNAIEFPLFLSTAEANGTHRALRASVVALRRGPTVSARRPRCLPATNRTLNFHAIIAILSDSDQVRRFSRKSKRASGTVAPCIWIFRKSNGIIAYVAATPDSIPASPCLHVANGSTNAADDGVGGGGDDDDMASWSRLASVGQKTRGCCRRSWQSWAARPKS